VGMGAILCSWAGIGGHGCDFFFFMGGRGCNIIFHGWAWVRCYFSWVGVGAMLFFMGGRGCDIIVHGWAWAIAKHIE
jgi:hypothetical protein